MENSSVVKKGDFNGKFVGLFTETLHARLFMGWLLTGARGAEQLGFNFEGRSQWEKRFSQLLGAAPSQNTRLLDFLHFRREDLVFRIVLVCIAGPNQLSRHLCLEFQRVIS